MNCLKMHNNDNLQEEGGFWQQDQISSQYQSHELDGKQNKTKPFNDTRNSNVPNAV